MEIICFGDSITRGYDVPYGRGWVEICDASIEGVNFTNYGEDGCSVQGMIYNIENWAVTAVSDPTRHIFLMCVVLTIFYKVEIVPMCTRLW